MLYSNFPLPARDRIMSQSRATVTCLQLGSLLTSEQRLILPTNFDDGYYLSGLRPDLTIGTTHNGHFRISNFPDENIYMILTSRSIVNAETFIAEHGPTACEIFMPRGSQPDILFFAANRKGDWSWDEVLMRVNPGDIFFVQAHAGHDACTNAFYIVGRRNIYEECEHTVDAAYHRIHESLFPDRPAPETIPQHWQNIIFGKHRTSWRLPTKEV